VYFVLSVDPNVPENDTLINIARFRFGLNMFTPLPLELFGCRDS
jgi:solute carrier family 38 (sodium-coupled neutral amino acid transporter), member 11